MNVEEFIKLAKEMAERTGKDLAECGSILAENYSPMDGDTPVFDKLDWREIKRTGAVAYKRE